ncbi:helix-turn-helix domain-containing protein [Ideonella sp. 4Y11]|uniref:Helix-turn-helix domain-containing protein n=2 Tax=Ideonella aquatica TaxID=2824119 RepID=A0A941BG87_9BURK|nr:helix-turn-helix domain-containing protein [Ideonella aquatica]
MGGNGAASAGALLREARMAQGMHIAVLATHLKVSPRKLEALEQDRHDELQGPTFVRALAQAACRALKIDPAPILALLPPAGQRTLDDVGGGLNAPFREHGMRRDPALELDAKGKGVLVTVLVLLMGAALLWLVPRQSSSPDSSPAAAASSAAMDQVLGAASQVVSALTPASVPALVPAPVPAEPAAASAPTSAASVAAVPAAPAAPVLVPDHLLQVRATVESWVEVLDGNGQAMISRTLQPGETVDLDGALPLRVKIGNAIGTELRFRGQPVDLAAATRDNVARLELK